MEEEPRIVRPPLQLARLVFRSDGTLKTKLWLFGARGTWQLDEGQRTLRVVAANGMADTMTVTELTATRLVIHDATHKRQDEVYIPAD